MIPNSFIARNSQAPIWSWFGPFLANGLAPFWPMGWPNACFSEGKDAKTAGFLTAASLASTVMNQTTKERPMPDHLYQFTSSDARTASYYARLQELEQRLRTLSCEFGHVDGSLVKQEHMAGAMELTEVILPENQHPRL